MDLPTIVAIVLFVIGIVVVGAHLVLQSGNQKLSQSQRDHYSTAVIILAILLLMGFAIAAGSILASS